MSRFPLLQPEECFGLTPDFVFLINLKWKKKKKIHITKDTTKANFKIRLLFMTKKHGRFLFYFVCLILCDILCTRYILIFFMFCLPCKTYNLTTFTFKTNFSSGMRQNYIQRRGTQNKKPSVLPPMGDQNGKWKLQACSFPEYTPPNLNLLCSL